MFTQPHLFSCLAVRQVIPNIRSNSSGYSINGRKKRAVSESADLRDAGRLVRLARELRDEDEAPLAAASRGQSHILERRKRFLRIVGLTEEALGDMEKRIVRRDPTPVFAVKRKRIFVPRYKRSTGASRKKRQAFDKDRHARMLDIISLRQSVTKKNCKQFKTDDLVLPGDVSFGAKKQFSPQARTALRLSHFISNFLQNVDIYEEYGNLRGDKLLNTEVGGRGEKRLIDRHMHT